MIGCIWPIREEESSQSTVAFADECAMDISGDKADIQVRYTTRAIDSERDVRMIG